ncbi:MAG TPA: hypothetical protein VMH37_19180 [Candidatus Binataceae bacterium]|nr:hypothetical protein [Candidatus Binataceae bacterium]
MTLSSRLLAFVTFVAVAAAIAISPSSPRAEEAAADPELTAAAQKAFKAIADGDVDALKPLVEKKYAKKLTSEDLRPTQTGPKVTVAYDGNVKVMRADAKEAVVEANMFTPASNDIPKGEASKLILFMEKDKGAWMVDAPDKKEAASDATMNGGWYHPGAFTFCPNRGLDYLGSHFSNKLNCQSTAVCK